MSIQAADASYYYNGAKISYIEQKKIRKVNRWKIKIYRRVSVKTDVDEFGWPKT